MILSETFTRDWIYGHRNKKGFERINPPILEKMIHALALVEALAMTDLDFVFKGGTSLILLLPGNTAGRFSIDIDIITTAERALIENFLAQVCQQGLFSRFSLDERRSYQPGIPKAHYKLHYTALSGNEEHILLDILTDTHGYPQLVRLPVSRDWVVCDDQQPLIVLPAHESICGDKLTAFAPNTTGILFGAGKELEIVKQLFDIGRLYHEINNLETVAQAFRNYATKEIGYRRNQHSIEDVLDDIIATAVVIARRERNTEVLDAQHFKEIQGGLLQFRNYQMCAPFRIDEAIIASAKAALLAAKIKTASYAALPAFRPGLQKKDLLIQDPEYNFLNKLPPEPLFYWKETLQILTPQTKKI
jgi:hypothetical protein